MPIEGGLDTGDGIEQSVADLEGRLNDLSGGDKGESSGGASSGGKKKPLSPSQIAAREKAKQLKLHQTEADKIKAADKAKEKQAEQKNDAVTLKEADKQKLVVNAKKILFKIKELIAQGLGGKALQVFLKVLGTIVSQLESGSADASKIMVLMKKFVEKLLKKKEDLKQENYQKDMKNLKSNLGSELGGLQNTVKEGATEKHEDEEMKEFDKIIAGLDTNNDGNLDNDEMNSLFDGLSEENEIRVKEILKEVIDFSDTAKFSDKYQKIIYKTTKDFAIISAKMDEDIATGNRTVFGKDGFEEATIGVSAHTHIFLTTPLGRLFNLFVKGDPDYA